MRHANLLASLRQLAAAGLSGKTAWHAVEAVLARLTGFDHASLFWTDKDGTITDIQVVMDPVVLGAVAAFLDLPDAPKANEPRLPSYREFMLANPEPLETISRYPGFSATAFYGEILRPLGVRHMLRLALRRTVGPSACISLGRAGRNDYSRQECQRLLEALPLVDHALGNDSPVWASDNWETTQRATLIADDYGGIHFASPAALDLFHRIAGQNIVTAGRRGELHPTTGRLLRDMARRVALLERGRETELPALAVQRADGRYLLRAYRLDSLRGTQALLAVNVEWQLPLLVRLYAAGRIQGLPAREQQLVPLLLAGHSTATIATRLRIRQSTVAGYLHSLYVRLDISGRDGLRGALLGSSSEEPAALRHAPVCA